ncbi:MAG: tRNA (pseudouridine(54)-N(1))-methyltransferase TrmY [Thermoplasmata archaeon]
MSSSRADPAGPSRRFIVLGHDARTAGDFGLDDLAGATGRLDILLRCVNAAFMLSHDLRRDTELYLILLGPPRPPRTLRLVGSELRHLNPDERSTAALLRQALRSPVEGSSGPGIYVASRGLSPLLEAHRDELVYLQEEGEDIRRATLGMPATFLLSDHRDLTHEEEAAVRGCRPRVVRVGPRSLHADHAIVLVHNELDRRTR